MASAIDLPRSRQIMERALAEATFLRDSQRENVRAKAEDLRQERLVWESVPFRLMLEANRRCNVKCVHCDIERAGTGDLPVELIERLLDDVGHGSMEIMPFVGGEPTLAPMDELAALCRRHNQRLNFITNGLLFTRAYHQAIADVTARVHFSFHSHVPSVHDHIMPGVDFDTAVQNIRDAVELGAEHGTQVLVGAVAMDSNLRHLSEWVRFCADLGVRRVIIQKLYPWTKAWNQEGVDGRLPEDEVRHEARRALATAVELGVWLETNLDDAFGDPRNDNPQDTRYEILQDNSHIVELFHPGFCISTAITVRVEWDGSVLPCCRDQIVLGNLHEQGFAEIWNGEPMQRLRETFFQRELRPFCKRCMAFYNGHA
jgi:radical SAM protein with 4Fe4S-binding SPASM domain